MRYLFVLLAAAALTASSCIKSMPKNDECDILSAWVEGEGIDVNFYNRSQMKKENIPSNINEIAFTVRSLYSLPELAIKFDITPGATITPESGSVHDFKQGPVEYTVTAQDGKWCRKYHVYFVEAELPKFKFSFENVDEVYFEASKSTYNVFYELDNTETRRNVWASGNAGVAIMRQEWTPDMFPTKSVAEGYSGKGICLNTQDAGTLGALFGKPIAAGNLFLGNFNINAVLTDALKATEFGIPIEREPVRIVGFYKYQPGDTFTDKDMHIIPDRVDEASIYAVFYRNQDEQGNSIVLHGDDVLSSPYIIRKAQVASLPATDKWTRFEAFFEGGDADSEILAALGYSFTLVFSSSKDGASFEGAIGSTLYVDEVEVSFENEQ